MLSMTPKRAAASETLAMPTSCATRMVTRFSDFCSAVRMVT